MANTILPPRYDDRGSADAAALPAIPIYEETSGSLRPTWLPIDPSSYPPPTLRSREPAASRLAKGVQIGGLLFATWFVAFGSVVGGHVVRERFTKHATAASVSATADVLPMVVIAVRDPGSAVPAVENTNTANTSASTKTVDSGVTLTVDVNSLPISKDLPRRGKSHNGNHHRAAGS
ncbi:MAG: hypothetical protein ABI461_06720 [Polyangiaceae bacterium]